MFVIVSKSVLWSFFFCTFLELRARLDHGCHKPSGSLSAWVRAPLVILQSCFFSLLSSLFSLLSSLFSLLLSLSSLLSSLFSKCFDNKVLLTLKLSRWSRCQFKVRRVEKVTMIFFVSVDNLMTSDMSKISRKSRIEKRNPKNSFDD